MGYLADVGVSEAAERLHAALLVQGEGGQDELAGPLGRGSAAMTEAVSELVSLGLVAQRAERLVALPPRFALDAVAERRAREASAARAAAVELAGLWSGRDTAQPFVEILDRTAAVDEVGRAVMAQAGAELLALAPGPVGEPGFEPNVPLTVQMLDRGVVVRSVYGSGILQHPIGLEAVARCIERGEQARVCPEVPVTLLVTESCALVVLTGQGQERLAGLLIHPSDLHDRLGVLFEVFWGMGVPLAALTPDPDRDLRNASRELLLCLAAGLTDQSIAQKLGVSQRTVARRVSTLQDRLGARSRFQLGVQAIRSGWL